MVATAREVRQVIAAPVERFSRHVLHGDEVHAVGDVDVVDGDDVGMIQGRSGLGLLHEPALPFRIGHFLGR
jgi:hypothetical protein